MLKCSSERCVCAPTICRQVRPPRRGCRSLCERWPLFIAPFDLQRDFGSEAHDDRAPGFAAAVREDLNDGRHENHWQHREKRVEFEGVLGVPGRGAGPYEPLTQAILDVAE